GAHELTASVRRTQGALAQVRKRLHAVNERLFNEMEQHQALQKSLEHARYHDPFTGLPNRRYLMDQLDRALREVRTRRRQRIAVVLIEIDRFKLINDTLGHQRISVASRIGLTCIDSGLQRVEEALREADIALSFAKRQPAQPIVAYTPGMGGAAVSLVSLEADLHVALDRRQFRLLFQPIVDLRGKRVVGAESLLRWQHPVEGVLAPEKFLPLAEEAGVIVPVTRWVIQRVCRLAAEWRQRLPQAIDFYLSVNLSAASLRDPGLRDYVAQVLQETHTSPRQLKFELTEVGLISNV